MEYFISKSNFSDFFPNLLNGVHFGRIWWNEIETNIFGNNQGFCLMPCSAIAYRMIMSFGYDIDK